MGNTVVLKPPKQGVLLYKYLLKHFAEAFPKGVVNTVFGDGETVISPLMKSGKINCLAFIGTCKIADHLKRQHPNPHRLKCILGLEAKNPAIILKDANIESSVTECIKGAFSYNGQRCTAIKIIWVHEDIIDNFLRIFANEASKLKLGLPWEKGVTITPLPEETKVNSLQDLIADATSKGANVINLNGSDSYGTILSPTVLYPVYKEMKIYHIEQFGPVIPIASYKSLNQVIDYIEKSNYGQQASIFGKNEKDIGFLVDMLANQVSRININSQCQRGPDFFPFTGRKDSAEGTLSITDALKIFSIRSMVAFNGGDLNKSIVKKIVKNKTSNFISTDFIL